MMEGNSDTNAGAGLSAGRVTAVRGAVVDVVFNAAAGLPPIGEALWIDGPEAAIAAEVQAHLDEHRVRALALYRAAPAHDAPLVAMLVHHVPAPED